MKKLISMLLAVALMVGVMVTPASAVCTAQETQNGVTGRYIDGIWVFRGEVYSGSNNTVTLADMAATQLKAYGLISSTSTSGTVKYGDVLNVLYDRVPTKFSDVPSSLEDAVNWALVTGVTKGTTETTFSPNATVTRGQAVTFLWRAAGSPDVSGKNPFTDVSSSAYYYKAVLWAVQHGITKGTTSTTFSPNATCMRGQILTMLYRSKGSPDVGPIRDISGIKDTDYYAGAINWAINNGVAKTTSYGSFDANDVCPRGEMVSFIYKANGSNVSASATKEAVFKALGNYLGWKWSSTSELYTVAEANGFVPGAMSNTLTKGDLYLIQQALINNYSDKTYKVSGSQVATPGTVKISADSIHSAEAQIALALMYAPTKIAVTLTSSSEANTLYNYYKNWKSTGNKIDLFINAIETGNSDSLVVTKSGNTVTFAIDYSDGWLARVDVQDWVRVYKDTAYSEKLASFVKTYVDPIKAKNLSDAETVKAVTKLLVNQTSYNKNGGDKIHCIVGLLNGKELVCDGYAIASQFILNYLGVDCFVASGAFIDRELGCHAWNKVCIDGTWYVLDVSYIEAVSYAPLNRFLVRDSNMEKEIVTKYAWYNTIYPASTSYKNASLLWKS